jgi:hypothetical protein
MRCKGINKGNGKRCQKDATIGGYCTTHFWLKQKEKRSINNNNIKEQ